MKKVNKYSNFSGYIWLLPYFFFSLFFVCVSLFLLITNASLFGKNTFQLVSQSVIISILWRSIWTGLLTAVIAVFLSLLYVWFALQSPHKSIQYFLIFLLEVPMFIFTISKIWALKGLFSQFFALESLNSYWFMIVGMLYLYLPLASIPIYTVLKSIPQQFLEASYSLGYSKFRSFFSLVIPYAQRAILRSLVIVFLTASMTIIVSDRLLPSGQSFTMIANAIYVLVHPLRNYDFSQLTILILITLIILISISAFISTIPKFSAWIRKLF